MKAFAYVYSFVWQVVAVWRLGRLSLLYHSIGE